MKKGITIITMSLMLLTMVPVSLFAATTDSSSRLSGVGRVETALEVCASGWESASTLILAPADETNLVDALAAAPLAGQENAPILLTPKDSLNSAVKTRIKDLGVKQVYVIGAISDAVQAEVSTLSGVNVVKLAGINRIETAKEITRELDDPKGTFVVGYEGLADALSVASYAAANNYAIAIANVDGSIAQEDLAGDTTYIVGGTALVDDIGDSDRFAGSDRFATNLAVAKGLTFNFGKIYLANGITLVDALSVAPLAARSESFVLLCTTTEAVHLDEVTDSTKVVAVGGTAVVPDKMIEQAVNGSDLAEGEPIQFSDLDDLILERNNTVQILDNTYEALEHNMEAREESMADAISDLKKNISKLDTSESESKLPEMKLQLEGIKSAYESATGDEKTELLYQQILLTNQISGIEQMITTREGLEDSLDDLRDQLNSFQDNIRPPALEAMEINVEMGKDAQVYMAQTYYLSYSSLERQIGQLENTYKNLQNQLEVLKLSVSLGLETDLAVSQLDAQVKELANSIASLKDTSSSLLGEINLLLGQAYDTNIKLQDTGLIVESSILNNIDHDDDFAVAEDESYTLRLAQNDVESKQGALDNAEVTSGNDSEEYESAELDLASSELKYKDAIKRFAQTFESSYNSVQQKKSELETGSLKFENAQKIFENAELKYQLGMLSKVSYEEAQLTFATEKLKFKEIRQALFKAYNDYQWLLKGLDTTSK